MKNYLFFECEIKNNSETDITDFLKNVFKTSVAPRPRGSPGCASRGGQPSRTPRGTLRSRTGSRLPLRGPLPPLRRSPSGPIGRASSDRMSNGIAQNKNHNLTNAFREKSSRAQLEYVYRRTF